MGLGAGAGASPSPSPIRSESRSFSGAAAGAADGSACMWTAGEDDGRSSMSSPIMPRMPLSSGGPLFFFSKAGMRSSTPLRMPSIFSKLEYSTERCCISSDIEAEVAASICWMAAMAAASLP